MNFSYVESNRSATIKVIGVGGAGGNAVNNMINANLQGVKFIAANTDAQALETSNAEIKIQLGKALTEGLGAGADPNIGREAALESMDEIREALEGSHMVFITAGFGGGTGTGAAPVIAEICKDLGILTVAVASKPFSFEGKKRERQALDGLDKLHGITDTVITIPNDRLRGIAPKGARMVDMFIKADEILHHSVKGITDLIMMPGHVNLDFADVKTTMQKAGKALMGIGIASGENRATEAAEKAISHPLLEDISISGAKGEVGDDAEIIWGQTFDESLGDEIRITVIATGIGADEPVLAENMHRFELPAQQAAPVYGSQPVQHQAQAQAQAPTRSGTPNYANGSIARGKLRTPTPEELADWNEFDNPVRVTQKRVVGGEDIAQPYSNTAFDNDNLEVPTFLRRKAD